jgi:uncharacterized membrane protein YfcA
MNEVLAVLIAVVGGLAGGLVGVGGGVLFVPALAIFIGLSQVEAESTSLLMIVIVAAVGAYRQYGHGNLNLGDAVWIGVLSPVGVGIGVVASNLVSQRVLELCFAALALFVAFTLVRRALAAEEEPRPSRESESHL